MNGVQNNLSCSSYAGLNAADWYFQVYLTPSSERWYVQRDFDVGSSTLVSLDRSSKRRSFTSRHAFSPECKTIIIFSTGINIIVKSVKLNSSFVRGIRILPLSGDVRLVLCLDRTTGRSRHGYYTTSFILPSQNDSGTGSLETILIGHGTKVAR